MRAVKQAAMIALTLGVMAGQLSPLAYADRGSNWGACVGGVGYARNQSIDACTALIEGGRETPDNLAVAYNNRGNAYARGRPLPNAEDVAAELKKLGFEIFGFPATNSTKIALEREIETFRAATSGATVALTP